MIKIILGVMLLIQSLYSVAGNTQFIEFAVKQAHIKNFMGCDAAIRSAFQIADGDDINVHASWFDETLSDSMTLTATFGSKGNSAFIIANLRKYMGKCYLSRTTVTTEPKSCTAVANESKQYVFRNETGDYTWFENNGGAQLLLKPLNNGCIATYLSSGVF